MKRFAILLTGLLLLGCEAGNDNVVARVDGEAITQTEWDAAVSELERSARTDLDAAGRRKVLESLVQSRLMARAAGEILSEADKAALEARAQLQHERLLVKEYLRRAADPAPLTEEAVRAWYAQHPEMFGAREIRHFELLTTERAVTGTQRKNVLEAMRAVRDRAEWESMPAVEGVRWVHRLENDANAVLDRRITAAAAGLEEGVVSEVLFVEGRPYLVRVKRIERSEPKPLPEVRAEIVRRLQIEQLQQAVETAGEELLEGAEVEYLVPAE